MYVHMLLQRHVIHIGILSADQASGILLQMKMHSQWSNPFGLEECSFSRLFFKDSITSLGKLKHFGMYKLQTSFFNFVTGRGKIKK